MSLWSLVLPGSVNKFNIRDFPPPADRLEERLKLSVIRHYELNSVPRYPILRFIPSYFHVAGIPHLATKKGERWLGARRELRIISGDPETSKKLSAATDHYAMARGPQGQDRDGSVEQTESPLHGLKRSAEAAAHSSVLPSTFHFPSPSLLLAKPPLTSRPASSFRSGRRHSRPLLSINFVSVSLTFHEIIKFDRAAESANGGEIDFLH